MNDDTSVKMAPAPVLTPVTNDWAAIHADIAALQAEVEAFETLAREHCARSSVFNWIVDEVVRQRGADRGAAGLALNMAIEAVGRTSLDTHNGIFFLAAAVAGCCGVSVPAMNATGAH